MNNKWNDYNRTKIELKLKGKFTKQFLDNGDWKCLKYTQRNMWNGAVLQENEIMTVREREVMNGTACNALTEN